MKRVYKDENKSAHWSAAKNKEPFFSRRLGFVISIFWKYAQADFCDPLEGTRDLCLLGKLFCWQPICPTSHGPPAGRPDPTRPWYVRVLGSTS